MENAHLATAPSSSAGARTDEHDRYAASAIARAVREIPFYARHRDAVAEGVPLEEMLAKLPLLFKKDVRRALPKSWVPAGRDVKAELESGALEIVETSGSTEDRLNILWDRGWWLAQEERAMRTNALVARAMDGAFGAYQESILTTPVCGGGQCHIGDLSYEERLEENHLFLNMRADPTFWRDEDKTRMLDEIERHATVGLEADPAYLAALALHAEKISRRIVVSGFTQLTYASTTRAHVRSIRRAYDGPLFQLYGASEVGVLFMEGEDARLHHSPITTHVELLPARVATPAAEDVALVVVTTLDRIAQPLLRFVVGDLVSVDRKGPRKFSPVAPLRSIEGRVQDAVVRADGAIITTGAIDRALEPIDGIETFQVRQHTPDAVEVDVVPREPSRASLEDDAKSALVPLFGSLRIAVRRATAVAAEPSGKFRVCKRDFPVDVATCFEIG
jgi:phenylacetate-CoA ligase